jgi:hypothetical protein
MVTDLVLLNLEERRPTLPNLADVFSTSFMLLVVLLDRESLEQSSYECEKPRHGHGTVLRKSDQPII